MHARAFSLSETRFQAGFFVFVLSYFFVIQYCCAIDNRLLTTQYRTRPDGKKKNVIEKAIGKNIIISVCTLLGAAIIMFIAMLFTGLIQKVFTFVYNIVVEIQFRM